MKQLRRIRQGLEMTQTELARLLGVRIATVNDWEHGRRKPRSEMLPRIAKILGVSIESLFDSAA